MAFAIFGKREIEGPSTRMQVFILVLYIYCHIPFIKGVMALQVWVLNVWQRMGSLMGFTSGAEDTMG